MSGSPLKNPRLQLMLMIALITASLFWIWFISSHRPRTEEITVLVEHQTQLRASNQESRRTIAALGLDEIRAAIEAYDRQAQQVGQFVPPDTVILEPHAMVSTAAQRYGVEVGDVVSQPARREGEFQVHPFQVSAEGEYHDVGAFLTEILSQTRIFRMSGPQLTKVERSVQSATGTQVPEFLVTVSFVLEAYSTPTSGEGTPEPPGQGGAG